MEDALFKLTQPVLHEIRVGFSIEKSFVSAIP